MEPLDHGVKAVVETGRYETQDRRLRREELQAGLATVYVPVGRKTVHSVESDGMLASASELGINKDHEGIVEVELAPGDPIPRCVPDSVIELDNKSITHRPDLWGHHGMAREVAAILELPLQDPARLELLPTGAGAVKVQIEDYNLCPRYSALVFENVTVRLSPLWLQARLTAIGNPINNIVDQTNFAASWRSRCTPSMRTCSGRYNLHPPGACGRRSMR